MFMAFIVITKAMHKNSSQLFGLNKVNKPTNVGAEYVSHFYEMVNVNNDSLSEKVYMPVSNKLIKVGREGYSGKLYDGLHFDVNLESISYKIEFKSAMVKYFNNRSLSEFESDYSKLGVDRIDLCHINSKTSCVKTTEVIESFNSELLIFNPIDWAPIFNETANKEFIDFVDFTIIDQILLNPILSDVWD